jgi:hypothetical protein
MAGNFLVFSLLVLALVYLVVSLWNIVSIVNHTIGVVIMSSLDNANVCDKNTNGGHLRLLSLNTIEALESAIMFIVVLYVTIYLGRILIKLKRVSDKSDEGVEIGELKKVVLHSVVTLVTVLILHVFVGVLINEQKGELWNIYRLIGVCVA